MHTRVLLFLLGVALVGATWRGCGDPCQNSNQCNDALCSRCNPMTHLCESGLTCNSTCSADSDCERLRYCYLCTNTRCAPGPSYAYKCAECTTDADCPGQHPCNKCIDDAYPDGKKYKRCAAGCGGKCSGGYDCGYNTACSRCDPLTGICTKGRSCGQSCGTDGDCDSASECRLCIDNTCSSPCSGSCTTSFDCNAPVTGCGVCTNGQCAPGVQCGSRCLYDRDCLNAGTCNNCVNNQCVAVNCGDKCESNDQCGKGGKCPSCTNSTCTAPQCGSMCATNLDCIHAGNCSACTAGYCTRPSCGSQCQVNQDCAGTTCPVCVAGQCTRPVCGSECEFDDDCSDAGSCVSCQTNQCTPNLPPQKCNEYSSCTPGNNNQCPQDSCSHCDPFTATCRIGAPCGSACIVSTDCNQLGSCPRCLDKCIKVVDFVEQAAQRYGAHLLAMDPSDVQKFVDEARLASLNKPVQVN